MGWTGRPRRSKAAVGAAHRLRCGAHACGALRSSLRSLRSLWSNKALRVCWPKRAHARRHMRCAPRRCSFASRPARPALCWAGGGVTCPECKHGLPRLAAWRGRTEHRTPNTKHQTPNTKDMDSRLRGNDEARVRVNDGKVVAVAGGYAPPAEIPCSAQATHASLRRHSSAASASSRAARLGVLGRHLS